MLSRTLFRLLLVVPLTIVAGPATAQPKVEVGGSLASLAVGLGDDNEGTIFGVPSATFGLFGPGVYASFFAGPYFAVEPQIGLVWVSENGESEHIVSAAAQADFFFAGSSEPSPYVFASGGVVNTSGSDTTPKSVSAGGGFRVPVGDRLVFRVDGRYVHFTEGGGNAVVFGVSIGGAFGR